MIQRTETDGRSWRVALVTALVTGVALLWVAQPVVAGLGDSTTLAKTQKVTGGVLDADGKPAAGVAVKLIQSKKTAGRIPIPPGGSQTGDAVIGVPPPTPLGQDFDPNTETLVKSTTTDGTGKFAFDGLVGGIYTVVAGAGPAAVRQQISVTLAKPPPPVNLKLNKAG